MPLPKAKSTFVTNENQDVKNGVKQVLASRTALADVNQLVWTLLISSVLRLSAVILHN